jgi:hypothetical protein
LVSSELGIIVSLIVNYVLIIWSKVSIN